MAYEAKAHAHGCWGGGGWRHQRCEMIVVVVMMWMAVFGRGRVQKAGMAGGQHGNNGRRRRLRRSARPAKHGATMTGCRPARTVVRKLSHVPSYVLREGRDTRKDAETARRRLKSPEVLPLSTDTTVPLLRACVGDTAASGSCFCNDGWEAAARSRLDRQAALAGTARRPRAELGVRGRW